jgi:maltooligosyltrehalose trehalohydrolase
MVIQRRYPIGAEASSEGVHFRVWALDHSRIDLIIESDANRVIPMNKEEKGYFSLFVKDLQPETL